MTVSEQIFKLMEARVISQHEFARMTGISQSTISDWKNKKTTPTADKIPAICRALNVSIQDIFPDDRIEGEKLFYISAEDELAEFIKLYRSMNKGAAKRILAYAIAMMKLDEVF